MKEFKVGDILYSKAEKDSPKPLKWKVVECDPQRYLLVIQGMDNKYDFKFSTHAIHEMMQTPEKSWNAWHQSLYVFVDRFKLWKSIVNG